MKRLFIVVLALFLPLLFAGCGQRESSADDGQPQESQIRASGTQNTQENQIRVSDPPDTLRFTSMREFLENHKKVAGDRAFEEISALAESVNFMGLERFYLPVGIPEEYQLYRLAVEEGVVALWFLPEEHLVSEGTMRVADARQQHFLFSFTRWEIDSPRDIKLGQLRITEDDLVNGAYTRFHFNNNNRLWWTSETEHIMMYFPMPTSTPHGTFSIPDGNDGFMTLSVEDLGRFTQTYTLDLTNPAAIDALLATLPPSHHQLSFDMGADGARGVDIVPASIDVIEVPVFTNIDHYLRSNHNGFTTNPTKEGYTFMGWYLDEGFTMALASREGFLMPARDAVLYARWQVVEGE